MEPIRGFENVQLGGRQLPVGGYVCRIMAAEVQKARSGKPMLVVSYDIAEGEYAGHFATQYKASTSDTKRWNGIYRIMLPYNGQDERAWDASVRNLKRLTQSAEESNSGYKWDWDERKLKGKLIGMLFRREEFIGQDGNSHFSVRPATVTNVETIRNGAFTLPADRLLDNNTQAQTFTPVAQEAPVEFTQMAPTPAPEPMQMGFVPVEDALAGDSDLPF